VSVPFVLQAVHLAFYPWFYGTFLEEACQESEEKAGKLNFYLYRGFREMGNGYI
jgi:hypothetical protein